MIADGCLTGNDAADAALLASYPIGVMCETSLVGQSGTMTSLTAVHATVFNVQRFSIHDGPGIRTTLFFKGCPLRCRWCQNPESLDPRPELALYSDRCLRSGECVSACARRALSTNGDGVHVLRERCDVCGDCVRECPAGALELVGRSMSIDEVLGLVRRDKPFYDTSGGGVTVSGGEATMQMEFLGRFAERCGQAGIRVGLQTCGAFAWEKVAPRLGAFEFIHYDLKLMDDDAHRRATGGSNKLILHNARRLSAARAPVIFRMPIVPGQTDAEENVRAVAAFLREIDTNAVHLLAYHAMGLLKARRVGCAVTDFELPANSDVDRSLRRAAEIFAEEKVAARWEA